MIFFKSFILFHFIYWLIFLRPTYQKTMQHNHPAPSSIWRVLIPDLLLFLLLCSHGIPSEQIHDDLGFNWRQRKVYMNTAVIKNTLSKNCSGFIIKKKKITYSTKSEMCNYVWIWNSFYIQMLYVHFQEISRNSTTFQFVQFICISQALMDRQPVQVEPRVPPHTQWQLSLTLNGTEAEIE